MSEECQISVAPKNGQLARNVSIQFADGTKFHDCINVHSAKARRALVRGAAEKLAVDVVDLEWLDDAIVDAANEVDIRVATATKPTSGRKNQATQLMELAEGVELFHDPGQVAYARISGDGHYEVVKLRTAAFRRWLAAAFYHVAGHAPSEGAIENALQVLEGNALYKGPERRVHLRVAEHDGRIYVDLGDRSGNVIEITADGWQLREESPVMFRRPKGMLPHPVPVRGGSLDELRAFVNVAPGDWPLVAAWLVAALQPRGPDVLLAVQGAQGSAKTTLCKTLRQIIDPHEAPLRSDPRQLNDLVAMANNNRVVAIDNLSHMSDTVSDALCRIATAGGFTRPASGHDDEETILDLQRPVILCGIEELVKRGDLLDRSIVLNLPTIADNRRRLEVDLDAEFEEARPRIFGALLSAASTAQRNRPFTRIDNPSRMADFEHWATAAEPGLGLAPGEFLRANRANRADAIEVVLSSTPIGSALPSFLERAGGSWSGTATELLEQLNSTAEDALRRQKGWPKSAAALSGILHRLETHLRAVGVEVRDKRRGHKGTKVIGDHQGGAGTKNSVSSVSSDRRWAAGGGR
ncbi:MAG: ATP-binding protein [Pirellulales bacterium]